MTDHLCPDCKQWTDEACDCAEAPAEQHPPCPNGGMSEDDQGRPVWCVTCRPHLARSALTKRAWGYDRPPRPKETP